MTEKQRRLWPTNQKMKTIKKKCIHIEYLLNSINGFPSFIGIFVSVSRFGKRPASKSI